MANITLGQLRDLWQAVADWANGLKEPKVQLSGSLPKGNNLIGKLSLVTSTIHPYDVRFLDICWHRHRNSAIFSNQYLHLGGVNSRGKIIAVTFDLTNGASAVYELSDAWPDDHLSATCVLVPGSGRKVAWLYARRGSEPLVRYRLSSSASGAFSMSGQEGTFETGGNASFPSAVSYSNTVVFYETRAGNNKAVCVRASNVPDLSSWSPERVLFSAPMGTEYFAFPGQQSANQRIVGMVVFRWPSTVFGAVWALKVNLETGDIMAPDDTVLANIFTGAGFPLNLSGVPKVHDSAVSGLYALGSDVRVDLSGRLHVLYYVQHPDSMKIAYRHALWNGSWQEVEFVEDAGPSIAGNSQPNYAGDMAFGKLASTVYASQKIGETWEIVRYGWNGESAIDSTYSSTRLTTGSKAMRVRPQHVVDGPEWFDAVWLAGWYTNIVNYLTVLETPWHAMSVALGGYA